MASLVLGVAGALVGGFFGGPMGASIGYLVGSGIGNLLFPQDTSNDSNTSVSQTGPRLSDLKVQSSTYGNMLPIVFGTMRVSGNMIWSTDIIETQHVTTTTQSTSGSSSGGKGGGGSATSTTTTTTTTYTYSINCAFALCEGVIVGVSRIWANGTLIFDQTPENAGITLAFAIAGNGGSVTVYQGTESQYPDPLIESYVGGYGNAPGFRGVAYAVLNGFQLADYGNGIPNFTWEVVTAGSIVIPGTITLQSTMTSNPYVISNPFDGCMYVVDTAADSIYKLDPISSAVINSREQTIYGLLSAFFYDQVTAQLYFYTAAGQYYLIDPTTLIAQFAWDDTAQSNIGGFPIPYVYYCDTDLSRLYGTFLVVPSPPTPFFTGINVLTGYGPNNTNAIFQYRFSNIAFVGLAFDNATGLIWGFADPAETGYNPYLWNWNIRSGLGAPISTGLLLSHYGSGAEIINGVIDPVSHRLAVYYGGDDSNNYILKVDLGSNSIVSTTQVPASFDSIPPAFNSIDSELFWFSDHITIVTWNIYNDVVTYITYPYTSIYSIASVSYDPRTDAMIWGLNDHTVGYCVFRIVGPRIESIPEEVGQAVEVLCKEVNLSSDQLDVSALTAPLDGYFISNVTTVRSALQQLMSAYYFDAVQSDGIIKFVPRGAASVGTITQDDLGAQQDSDQQPDILTIIRTQELDLPSNVTVNYWAEDNDYLLGTQYAQRQEVTVLNIQSLNFSMAFTDDAALNVATFLLYDAWVSRTAYNFQTTYKFIAFEPCDVVTIVNGEAVYVVRITKKTIQAGLILWEAVDVQSAVYDQDGTGGSSNVPTSVIALESLTRLFYMDIPQIRDADNAPGVYLAVAPSNPLATWTGATIARSADAGNSYQDAATFFTASECGVSETAIGSWSGENYWDYKSTVTVSMINGELSSISELQALNGQNLALLGKELIIFKNAIELTTGVYQLTNFLRGRFGTEQYISGHTSVENFIVLTSQTTIRYTETLNDINAIRLYRAVTFRTQLFTAIQQPNTDTGVSLMPLSPIDIYGIINIPSTHDITINWTRRTRIGGGWNDYADVPLGETTEAYEVDILNSGVVVRTLTASTNTVVYTGAMNLADFGSYQTSIDVNVYQISASIGRGFPGSATV